MPARETVEVYEKFKHPYMREMRRMHYHSKNELYYLINGSTNYFIEDEFFVVKPGELIFIPKNVLHKTSSDAERILLFFDDIEFGDNFSKYVASLHKNKHIIINRNEQHKVSELLRKIELEEQNKNEGYIEMQKLYVKELLILISRYRTKHLTEKLSSSHQLVQNVAKYITSHYAEDLSLKSLSAHFFITPNYLSKQFKKYTDIGINDYINITRVSVAEKLLIETDLSITELALRCGFNNSNYFAYVFKKIKGVTPKKYSLANKQNQ